MAFTLQNFKEDLEDVGAGFDGPPGPGVPLGDRGAQDLAIRPWATGVLPPGYRFPYGHTHKTPEEVYVVLRGSGRG